MDTPNRTTTPALTPVLTRPATSEKPRVPAHRPANEEELRALAEDIVRYCPSLTQMLLAMGQSTNNPLAGRN